MGKLIKGSTWFDKDKEEEVFGIKVKMDGKWYDAGDDSGLLFFDTKEDRNKAMTLLKEKGIPTPA